MSDLRERRMNILNLVASGELTLEQGNRLLVQLEQQAGEDSSPSGVTAWPTTLAPAGEDPDPPAAPDMPVQAAQPEPPTVDGAESDPPPASAPSRDDAALLAADPPPAAVPSGNAGFQPEVVVPEVRSSGGSRGWWTLPFILGLFLTLVSVNWMYLGYASAGLGWGFWLSFLPLALGIVLMWAGWQTRQARWLHLRVQQRPGNSPHTIVISFPLPIGLTRWAVQRFGKYSPGVNGQNPVDILDELDQALAADGPTHIYVDSQRGEQVELWIDGPS